jgi:hypothetical protein
MAKYDEMILNGHGGWELAREPAWAQVPKGTTIKFLTGNLKLLQAQDITDEEVALKVLEQFRNGDIDQEGTEYKYVPNYVLSDDGVAGQPEWVHKVSADTPLCTSSACDSGIHNCDGLFADPDLVGATLYWAACRYVELDEVAGPALGVNTTGVRVLTDAQIQVFVDELIALDQDAFQARFEQLGYGIYDENPEIGPADFERLQEMVEAQMPEDEADEDEDEEP